MDESKLSNAAANAGKRVTARASSKSVKKYESVGPAPGSKKTATSGPIKGATKDVAGKTANKVKGAVAKKAGAPDVKGLTPKGLKAERDANKNASSGQKSKKILKDTIKGATGSSAEGKLVGGGLQGAAVGLAKAVLTTTKGRWILAALLLPFLPLIFWIIAIMSIGSSVSSLMANNAVQTSATSGSTGMDQTNLSAIQSSAESSITPWELMAATVYYETGIGSSVAQTGGACPPGSALDSICPSVVTVVPSSPGASPASSSGAPATPTTGACVPSSGYVGIGIDCAVGRNGSVPAVIAPTSPDYSTTDTADWACIRQAESTDQYASTSAPSGAYGILESTWVADGFATLYNASQPYLATPAAQNNAALFILNNHPNSFYPGWSDLCTIFSPGHTPPPTISAIAPGVELPGSYSGPLRGSSSNPSATSSGTCPAKSSGPYCILTTALPTKNASNVTLSSVWFGQTLSRDLYKTAAHGNLNLLQGVTATGGTKPPTFNPHDLTAQRIRGGVMKALGMLPIANNSVTLDRNIYQLATNWAAGYSPQAGESCATNGAQPTSLSVIGPGGPIVLTNAQLTLAARIVKVARQHSANSSTMIAMIVDALNGSMLGQSATYASQGVFGDGTVSVPSDVVQFLSADKARNASPATQAAILGTPASALQPWVAAATTVVQSLTDTLPSCSYGVSIPNVPGGSPQAQLAMTAAKTGVGAPYVWGGGGTSGMSLGLSGLGAPACSGGFVVATAIYGSGNPCDAAYAMQTGKPGFDCSGLIQFAFAKAGVALPRTSQAQYLYVQARSTISTDIMSLQPGDLFFYFPDSTGLPDHVVMYLGMVETGSPVTSTVSSCTPSKVMSGLVELATTCSAIASSPNSPPRYTQTVTTFTPTIIQSSEEGSDVAISPWYSTGWMGGGPAA